jgi:hypothetical protein
MHHVDLDGVTPVGRYSEKNAREAKKFVSSMPVRAGFAEVCVGSQRSFGKEERIGL